MKKCNLYVNQRQDGYEHAVSFLEYNDFEIVTDEEAEYVFVLKSYAPFSEELIEEIRKAHDENKKIAVLHNSPECAVFLESWLMECACVAFSLYTGEELDMLEE